MGGAQAFAVPQPKRARAESPEATSSRSSLERTISTQTANTKTDEDDGHSRRDDGQLSFGEKLRAGKDADEDTSEEETKPELEAQSGTCGILHIQRVAWLTKITLIKYKLVKRMKTRYTKSARSYIT